jgi:hypothetical protein
MADKKELAKYLEKPAKAKSEDLSDVKDGEAGEMANLRLFEKMQNRGYGPDAMSLVDQFKCFEKLVRNIAGK